MKICPECGEVLKCMVVIEAKETISGKTERLYLCKKCLSSWSTEADGANESEPTRYFFG